MIFAYKSLLTQLYRKNFNCSLFGKSYVYSNCASVSIFVYLQEVFMLCLCLCSGFCYCLFVCACLTKIVFTLWLSGVKPDSLSCFSHYDVINAA